MTPTVLPGFYRWNPDVSSSWSRNWSFQLRISQLRVGGRHWKVSGRKANFLKKNSVFFLFHNDKLQIFVCRLDKMKLVFFFAFLNVTHPCSIKAQSDLTLWFTEITVCEGDAKATGSVNPHCVSLSNDKSLVQPAGFNQRLSFMSSNLLL